MGMRLTIWARRADGLDTFCAEFPVVVQALKILSQDDNGKERGYLCSIRQFDFIVALSAAEHALANTVALSTLLQEKSGELIEAAQETNVVVNTSTTKAARGNPLVWKEVYE